MSAQRALPDFKMIAVILGLGLSGPVDAQTTARMTEGVCSASWAAFAALADMPAEAEGGLKPEVTPQGWCRVEGLRYERAGPVTTEARRFEWRGAGLDRFIGQRLPPTALEVRIDDIRVIPAPGDVVMDYLFRAQSQHNGIDLAGSAHWDAGARRLVLDGLTIDFPGDNELSASFAIEKVDLSSASAMQMSAGTMALSDLTLDITSHGLFENYVLFPFGPVVLESGGDPEAQVAELKKEARAVIAGLPESSFPAPTRAALGELVADMPNPAGRLHLHIAAPQGFGAARLTRFALTGLPQTVAEVTPIFDGVTVEARYLRSREAVE
ncbi:MAG: hypothetical protein R3E44_08465 [Paracoccaceae bacterium]